MKKILVGLISGSIGAIINIAFLLFAPDLKLEVYLSTVITWLAIGILMSVCDLKLNSLLKGIIVALLVSASSLVYTVSSSFSGAVWTLINTLVIGAMIGYFTDKFSSKLYSKNK
nr:hypothetical protein [uncultured Niameybacter sp.]